MAAENRPKVLGQLRPANTSVASIYSPPANRAVEITAVLVCNQSLASATYRIFLDDDGTTYDQSTALYYDVTLATGTTSELSMLGWGMVNSAGNLAVRSSVASALTFTVFGKE